MGGAATDGPRLRQWTPSTLAASRMRDRSLSTVDSASRRACEGAKARREEGEVKARLVRHNVSRLPRKAPDKNCVTSGRRTRLWPTRYNFQRHGMRETRWVSVPDGSLCPKGGARTPSRPALLGSG